MNIHIWIRRFEFLSKTSSLFRNNVAERAGFGISSSLTGRVGIFFILSTLLALPPLIALVGRSQYIYFVYMPPEYVTWIETFVCWTSCDTKRGKKTENCVSLFI